MEKYRQIGVSLVGGMLAMCLAVPAFAQTPVSSGEKIFFGQFAGETRDIIENCDGATSTCSGEHLANGKTLELKVLGGGIDQFATVRSGRNFAFFLEQAVGVPDKCLASTVPVFVRGAIDYDGMVTQNPSFPPIGVNVEHTLKMFVFGSHVETNVVTTAENEFLVAESFIDTEDFALDLNLVRGRAYTVLLDAKLKGSCSGCIDFAGIFTDEFGPVTVEVGIDPIEILCSLEAKVDTLTDKVDAISGQIDTHDGAIKALLALLSDDLDQHDADVKERLMENKEAIMEAIRLLNTATGRREDFPTGDGS